MIKFISQSPLNPPLILNTEVNKISSNQGGLASNKFGANEVSVGERTGRMVKTIFDQPIEGGVSYEAEFRPEAIISGMYIYRVRMGEAMYNGKVTFKK